MSKDYSYLTVDEFWRGYCALTDSDLARLHLVCRKHCRFYNLNIEPNDLIQEALVRVFASERNVPTEIPLAVALAKIIQSIAHEVLNSSANKSLQMEQRYDDISEAVELASFADRSTEEVVLDDLESEENVRRIKLLFDWFIDDLEVTELLNAIANGKKAKEIVASVFKGQQVRYDTARKRLMRRIDKFHAEGVVG